MTSQNPNISNINSTGFNSMSGFGMGTMQPQQSLSTTLPQKQPAPDLSAFDSLLPSANKGTKGMSMNAMAHNKVPNKFWYLLERLIKYINLHHIVENIQFC